jgi:hypothetical protein
MALLRRLRVVSVNGTPPSARHFSHIRVICFLAWARCLAFLGSRTGREATVAVASAAWSRQQPCMIHRSGFGTASWTILFGEAFDLAGFEKFFEIRQQASPPLDVSEAVLNLQCWDVGQAVSSNFYLR